MRAYNVRTRSNFVHWLQLHKSGIRPNFLDGLSGGQKHNFLKQHRETILDLISICGMDWVVEQFQMSELTYSWFVRGGDDIMYSYQNKHKTTAKWLEHETVKDLFSQIDKINRRLASLEDTVNLQHVHLSGMLETNSELKREQNIISQNMQQFTQNTAEILSKLLLGPVLKKTLQPALNKVKPLKQPNLNINSMIKQLSAKN
jgi:hypothetical protein